MQEQAVYVAAREESDWDVAEVKGKGWKTQSTWNNSGSEFAS